MNNYNKAKENEVERFNKWYDSYENHPTKSNVLGYVIRNYARIQRATREDMREEKSKNRRDTLKHSASCPMGMYGIHRNCNCHYDDCLNYDWRKTKKIQWDGVCICHILTAKMAWAKEEARRSALPLHSRFWIWLFEPNHSFTKYLL